MSQNKVPNGMTFGTTQNKREVVFVDFERKNSNPNILVLGALGAGKKIYIDGLEQKCRVCGCTWDNACPGGCYWVEEDLCSQCAGRW